MAENQGEAGAESSAKPELEKVAAAKKTEGDEEKDKLDEKDEEKTDEEPLVKEDKCEDNKIIVDEDEGSGSLKLVLEDLEEKVEEKESEEKTEEVVKEDKPEVKSNVKEEEVVPVTAGEPDNAKEEDAGPSSTKDNDSKGIKNVESTDDKGDEIKKEETVEKVEEKCKNDSEISAKKDEPSEKDAGDGKNCEATAPTEAVAKIAEDASAAAAESKDDPEVGIVGPPTAACELLSEAELTTEGPALSTDEASKVAVADRVVRWVKNTADKAEPSLGDDDDRVVLEEEDDDGEIDDDEDDDDDGDEVDGENDEGGAERRGKRKRRSSSGTNGSPGSRKSQKVVSNIIRRSIRCLNKMHAMDSSGGNNNGKKLSDTADEMKREEEDEEARKSPKVPQSQQNGAALPEETASADRNLPRCQSPGKKDGQKDAVEQLDSKEQVQSLVSKAPKLPNEAPAAVTALKTRGPGAQRNTTAKLQKLQQQLLMQHQQQEQQQQHQGEPTGRETRKRRSCETSIIAAGSGAGYSSNGNAKKLCLDQREQFINSLIGSDKYTAEQLAVRAEQLRVEVHDLDELARAKEMEWNEILSMRKLKEEAYLRIERRRQIMGFMESNGPLATNDFLLPPASLALTQPQGYDAGRQPMLVPKEERAGSVTRDNSPAIRRERASKTQMHYQQVVKAHLSAGENGPKQMAVDAQSPEHRQIGEGRQGPIVDVRSIIADYRLRHPETVPRRRGRRMRNSVTNVGLGAGGAMVENLANMDSRPSSTDSCKSSSNANDPNNAMSFKDVLVQFAKLSQQQGEPIKTPQNYPDVTLHPVAAAPPTQNSAPQTTGSLLHGILTKSQSPRPTTFSPTLARLLTAPERERNTPAIAPTPHQTASQHLLQAYQGANPVSISDFLSSSKARTEITITPVVNTPIQTHSSNSIHIDDVDEETSIIEERDSRLSGNTRDNREDRDTPPRCQGCQDRAAQFVCAGCGNQWYCSRECQVAAWDEHSEVCSG